MKHEGCQPDREHHPPAKSGQQRDSEQRRKDASYRVAREHQRVGEAALVGRSIFYGQSDRHGYHSTQAQPGDKAEQAEELGRRRDRAQPHGYREPRDAEEHDLATPNYVGDSPNRQCAEEHAYQRQRTYEASSNRGQIPVPMLQQRRHHCPVDDQVVAVEDDGDKTYRHDP